MAHFVVTIEGGSETVSAWSADEAADLYRDQNPGVSPIEIDSIRPATVREALIAEYGEDFAREDYQNGMSHVFDVENNYRTDHRDMLIIRHACANDVQGYDDAVSVSNYRVLYESWSHLEGLSRGPYSNSDYIALDLDSEAPADLTEVLDGLADYPVIDEQVWSEVEQEMIQEHWGSYGGADVADTVAKALGADGQSDLTDNAMSIIQQLVWDGILDYGNGGGYPTMIDCSACDFGDKEIAAWFVEHVGEVVTVKSRNGYGDEITFDLRKSNLISM